MLSSSDAASKRRQQRLRREYLYRKSLEGSQAVSYEQKRQIRQALASGKSIPTELRASYDKLQREIDSEDVVTATQHSHVDDEYGDAGLIDPRVCVTTSRDPSSRLKQFAKEIKLMFPNSSRINRGNHRVDQLVASCKSSNFSDIIMVQETRGEPDGLVVCHLPLGPTAFFSLSGAVLRHDLPDGKAAPMSEAYPHIVLNNFDNTALGKRVGNILKCLFPVPNKPDTRRIVTFSNKSDFISFRHHMYSKRAGGEDTKDVTLHEVGPRFEMRLFQLRLGTLDQKDAETEYALRNFINTAHKSNVL
jgi:U3 small nucleolar ribonucleoprotein protein IMP4